MPRRALIIEDEVLIALQIEHQLRELGYEHFDHADCPQDALACALRARPDLITADYRIIAGTGLDAVNEIQRRIGRLTTVYISGSCSSLRSMTDAPILEKPLAVGALARAIDEAMPLRQIMGAV